MKIDFEEAMQKLEIVLNKLENETKLDKSIKLYKDGIDLSMYCVEKLNLYENDIKELKKNSNGIIEKVLLEEQY